MDCERLLEREARETRSSRVSTRPIPVAASRAPALSTAAAIVEAHLAGNVGEDLRRGDARQLGDQFVVCVLARDCGRRRVGRRNVGVCDRKGLARQRDRREDSCSACRRAAALRSAFLASPDGRRRGVPAGSAAAPRAARRARRSSAAARALPDSRSTSDAERPPSPRAGRRRPLCGEAICSARAIVSASSP